MSMNMHDWCALVGALVDGQNQDGAHSAARYVRGQRQSGWFVGMGVGTVVGTNAFVGLSDNGAAQGFADWTCSARVQSHILSHCLLTPVLTIADRGWHAFGCS